MEKYPTYFPSSSVTSPGTGSPSEPVVGIHYTIFPTFLLQFLNFFLKLARGDKSNKVSRGARRAVGWRRGRLPPGPPDGGRAAGWRQGRRMPPGPPDGGGAAGWRRGRRMAARQPPRPPLRPLPLPLPLPRNTPEWPWLGRAPGSARIERPQVPIRESKGV